MSNTTPDNMRGFIVPRILNLDDVWEAENTFNQQSPRGGVPVAQRSSGLVLQTAGDMTQNEHIEVLTQRAGHAGNIGGAKFVWRDASSGDYYGRNTANAISYFQHVIGTTTIDYLPRDVLATSNGNVFILAEKQTTAAPPALVIFRRVNETHTLIATLQTVDDASLNGKLYGGLCELSNGSIICAYWVHDTAADLANIAIDQSTDDGATWARVSTNAFKSDIGTSAGAADYVIGRIRLRENLGQILLITQLVKNDTSTNRMRLGQYASTDSGGTFTQITITDGTQHYGFPSLAVVNNQFIISIVSAADNAYIYRFSNAFLNISTVENNVTLKKSISLGGSASIATIATNEFTAGQSVLWVDDDGVLWVIFEQLSAAPFLFIVRSSDNGETWSAMGAGTTSGADLKDDGTIFKQAAGSTLEKVIGVSSGGAQSLYFNWSSIAATNFEGDMGWAQLGGYSTVTLPPVTQLSGDTERAAWSVNYLPFDLPDGVGWTLATSGTAAATIATGRLNITTTSGAQTYSQNITNDLMAGAIVRCRFKAVSRSTNTATIEIRISDGASVSQTIQLFVDTTTIRLWDAEAGAYLHAAVTVSHGPGLDVLIALADGQVNAYYLSGADGSPKKWVSIFQGATSSGTNTAGYVKFGHIGTSTAETDIYEFHYGDALKTGMQLSYGQNNPAEVWARGYPAIGNYTNLTGTLSISTIDGGTYEGDSWVINPSYEFPIDNLFYGSSPSKMTNWRSVTAASTSLTSMFLPLYIDKTAQDMTLIRNDIIGVNLENINFADFTIERHNGVSWAVIATVENKIYDDTFSRHGASITGGAATNYPYLLFNECTGFYAHMTPSGGGTPIIRKIKTNSEGTFGAVSSKQSIIYLEDIDGTEPASGDLKIIPSSCSVLINLLGASNSREMKAIGIRLTAQHTQEQYFQIGSFSWGELFVPGRQYGRGRSISFDAGLQITENNDGTRYTRLTGNSGRQIRISWADGVDSSVLYGVDAAPNYWVGTTSAGAEPIATENDVPVSMVGLVRYLDGSKNPIVYIPKFIKSTASGDDVQVLNRYGDHVLTLIDSDIEIKNVLGDEFNGLGTGELWRVTTIQLFEVR